MSGFEVEFDSVDMLDETDAAALINEIATAGGEATVARADESQGFLETAAIVALVSVATSSVAVLSVVAVFLQRTFHKGVLIDLTHARPRIRKHKDLPKGSVLILYKDGREELHESVAGSSIGELMKAAMENRSESTDDEPETDPQAPTNQEPV